jgi:predicted nucleic acid-binding protein
VLTFIDANVLLHYLTGVPAEQAERARVIVEREEPLYISETAFAEVAWTLDRRKDEYPRDVLVDRLVNLFRTTELRVWGIDLPTLFAGLYFCRPNRTVSFGDALVWARVRQDGSELYTFDTEFPQQGIQVLRP